MVTAEEIVGLGFMPNKRNQKIKQSGYSISGYNEDGEWSELKIIMNYFSQEVEIIRTDGIDRVLIYQGEVLSIKELEDRIQDGEY